MNMFFSFCFCWRAGGRANTFWRIIPYPAVFVKKKMIFFKKIFFLKLKKFKKPIDKIASTWYTIIVKGKGKKKKFKKIFFKKA